MEKRKSFNSSWYWNNWMATYKLKKKQENSINITLHAYKNEIEKNKT
jgi:hypothetical protein